MVSDQGERPSWGITKAAATGTIFIRFVGPTRTFEIPQFINALSEMMPAEDANVVFDLRQLVGHNPETKEPIKIWLLRNKHRIGQITVLVPKSGAMLKMVTAVIALATGVKIRISDNVDDSPSVASL
ncbi:MAG TPA: hypothetical protein VJN18_19845 [Polyangiaceae bacterium]|nr:hypothetical protein [Polyangiaceae bacterium]